jgi:hypothetical protein
MIEPVMMMSGVPPVSCGSAAGADWAAADDAAHTANTEIAQAQSNLVLVICLSPNELEHLDWLHTHYSNRHYG